MMSSSFYVMCEFCSALKPRGTSLGISDAACVSHSIFCAITFRFLYEWMMLQLNV